MQVHACCTVTTSRRHRLPRLLSAQCHPLDSLGTVDPSPSRHLNKGKQQQSKERTTQLPPREVHHRTPDLIHKRGQQCASEPVVRKRPIETRCESRGTPHTAQGCRQCNRNNINTTTFSFSHTVQSDRIRMFMPAEMPTNWISPLCLTCVTSVINTPASLTQYRPGSIRSCNKNDTPDRQLEVRRFQHNMTRKRT
jgi:hypothetical protein